MGTGAKRLVAVCDILGFKDLVRSTPLDQLMATHLDFFRKIIAHGIQKDAFPTTAPSLQLLRGDKHVGIGWFSDTVLLYTLVDSDEANENLLETLGWLLFETIFGTLKVRAGVAYGDLYDDPNNEIFVEAALVDAYELEQAQNWFGGALTQSAAERVRRANLEELDWWLHWYEVPLKPNSRASVSNLAVNWTYGLHGFTDIPWSRGGPEPSAAEWASRADVCAKWYHARRFHRDVCASCRDHQPRAPV